MTIITLEMAAERYAAQAHEGQTYGDLPYTSHLEHVVGVLLRFGVRDQATVAAGWLHDVVEDTDRTLIDLHTEFDPYEGGDRAIAMVDACTDGKGANRRERKERPFKLIPTVEGAVLVKLADRIGNVEASGQSSKAGLLKMYRGEHPTFKKRLGGHGGPIADDMWFYLDELLA